MSGPNTSHGLESWAAMIARRFVASLPPECAEITHRSHSQRERDATAAIAITPRRSDAAPIILYVYEPTSTVEVFIGRGLSFLFEGLTTDDRGDAEAEIMALCHGVAEGRVRERIVGDEGRIASIDGIVDTRAGPRASSHVVGRFTAKTPTHSIVYAEFCGEEPDTEAS